MLVKNAERKSRLPKRNRHSRMKTCHFDIRHLRWNRRYPVRRFLNWVKVEFPLSQNPGKKSRRSRCGPSRQSDIYIKVKINYYENFDQIRYDISPLCCCKIYYLRNVEVTALIGWPEFRRQNFESIKYWIDFSLIDFFDSWLWSIFTSIDILTVHLT
jgi:hypothetical protein